MYIKSFIIQTTKDIFIRFPNKIVLLFKFIGEYNRFKKLNSVPLHFLTSITKE